MARIFNISFPFNNVTYSAMVTSRSTPFFTEYVINMIDDQLLNSLPGNKIVAVEPDELKFLNVTKEHSAELMKEIILAVKERIKSVQV